MSDAQAVEICIGHLRAMYVRPSKSGLTGMWYLYNKEQGDILAVIKWHGAWRKYAAAFQPDVIFDAKCCKDLAEILERIMKEDGR